MEIVKDPSHIEGFDGSKIKTFVENEDSFNQYINKTFRELDTSHKGRLYKKELMPITGTLGESLGLPPQGTDPESDHIYDEVFAEFNSKGGVNKETFANVVRQVYLGIADGLERDPITIIPVDGHRLREYVGTGMFEADTVATFAKLDTQQDNSLQATKLVDALKAISIDKGMPPAGDPKMKGLIGEALASANVKTDDHLDQSQFVDSLKKVVMEIADGMEKSPVQVAHSEKVFDGKGIVGFLKDKANFQQALDRTWEKMPKDKKGKLRKDYLRVGVDELCPEAGLPPVGAVDEMDENLKTVFSKIDLDHGGYVNKQEFDKTMLEVLGSLMLQLEGKPVAIQNSRIIEESSASVAPSPA